MAATSQEDVRAGTEAAIEGVQASVDALKLLSGGWCLKIEIVIIVIVFQNI